MRVHACLGPPRALTRPGTDRVRSNGAVPDEQEKKSSRAPAHFSKRWQGRYTNDVRSTRCTFQFLRFAVDIAELHKTILHASRSRGTSKLQYKYLHSQSRCCRSTVDTCFSTWVPPPSFPPTRHRARLRLSQHSNTVSAVIVPRLRNSIWNSFGKRSTRHDRRVSREDSTSLLELKMHADHVQGS